MSAILQSWLLIKCHALTPTRVLFQFMSDASAVMQLLLKTQTDFEDLEDDDPQVKNQNPLFWTGNNPGVSVDPTFTWWVPDFVHDLGLGQDVQDPGQGLPAVSPCGDGPPDEDGLHQARGRPAGQ